MAQHLTYKGILQDIEDDGHIMYWLYTFVGGQQFYCSSSHLPLGHMVKIQYIINEAGLKVITRMWNLGEPI